MKVKANSHYTSTFVYNFCMQFTHARQVKLLRGNQDCLICLRLHVLRAVKKKLS